MKPVFLVLLGWCAWAMQVTAAVAAGPGDLEGIRKEVELRHLGVPYSRFVFGNGPTGASVDLMRAFARHLGVEYVFVPTSWERMIPDLIGRDLVPANGTVRMGAAVPVRGDVLLSGVTMLPWRRQVIAFSQPTIRTQVWLLTAVDHPLTPIRPTGDTNRDIALTRAKVRNLPILGIRDTCFDPTLYGLDRSGAHPRFFSGSASDLVAAMLQGKAEAVLQDAPDVLVDLEKWSGRLKVIGPVSSLQNMGAGFRREDRALRAAFDRFLVQLQESGELSTIIRRYYPKGVDLNTVN